jgi:phage baseplate assembly protein W
MSIPLDERRLGVDLVIPLDPDGELAQTPTGDLPVLVGRPNLHEAMRRRLATHPGTLLHRAEYGVGIPGFLEREGTPSMRAQIENATRRNLLRDKRLSEVRVTASEGTPDDAAAAAVTVDLTIQVRKDTVADSLTVSFGE